jgi:amino acid adenylation domain-containing protein
MRIGAPLSASLLERALREIVRRHETLRTSFAVEQGVPVQRIAAEADLPFQVEDLGGLPPEQREAQARAVAAEEGARAFDLAQAPLMRVRLLVMGPQDHILLLTLHHIISDGWSMGVLHKELGQIYTAFAEGRPSPLEPLPIQYADFALWQRKQLSGDNLDALLAFWRDQLHDAPPIIELPTDRPRPPVQTYRGGLHQFSIDPPVARAFAALAQGEGATLFMAVAAAVKLLLARYSGQDDIVIGTPIANRTRGDIEGLIGFFVNTLVLRSRIPHHLSFRALLAQVRETTLAAFGHQDLPFERLVEELQPERTLGHNPLFQVMLLFQAGAAQAQQAEPVASDRPPEMLTGTSKFDLTIALGEMGGTLSGAIEYNSDLFDPPTVETLAGHFGNLVGAIVADPDRPVCDLDMIGEAERARLLTGLAEGSPPTPEPVRIDMLVAQRAKEDPEAPALDFPDASLSYGELEARSNRLARALVAKGAGPGTRIGLWLDRSAALVVAMLASWKSGATFVTLDTRSPRERLVAMLSEAGVTLVVGREGEVQLPPGAVLLDLEAEADAIERRSARPQAPSGGADGIAQIIFTSGSTGVPKGVMLGHGQLLGLLEAMSSADLSPADRMGQVSNPAFDVMAFECWGALTSGACLVGIERDELLTPDGLALALTQRRISVLYQTAALFNQTAAHRPDAYRGVRLLLVGGDVVEPAKVRAAMIASRIPVFKHTYGPTETTVFCSVETLVAPPAEDAVLSLAPALANARLYIVGPGGRLAPTGTIGEIWIGGDCVALGYVGRPDLTAERFVPDPFSDVPGARAYRSGDVARLRADGTLEFLGRADSQVKIRGHRVEPAEVDSVLRKLPSIRDTVTICRGSGPERQLVSYFVEADPARPSDPEALRRHCKLFLPDHMVPSHFVRLTALPLTPNGKLDRAALPLPDRLAPEAAAPSRPPSTKTERAIADIWCRLLNLPAVGRQEHFFDIGGHSLLATQVISRLRDELGAELPLRVIFETPVLADLAAAVDKVRGNEGGQAAPALVGLSRAAYLTQRPGPREEESRG